MEPKSRISWAVALGDEGSLLAELLGVGDAVVALVRGAQAGELVGVGHPVKLAAVHNGSRPQPRRGRPYTWWWSG